MKSRWTPMLWLLAALALPAWAQPYPSKPLRIIVPFGPGSGTDLLARAVGERIGELWGQAVLIENREGAGGLLGAVATAKSAPDGYTIMLAANPFVVAPHLQPGLPYDAVKDFAAIARIGVLPMAVVTSANSRFRSMREMLDFARASPGKLNYASSGKGSPSHLEMELIKQGQGVQIQDIPYKNVGQAMTDTIAGEVALYFPTVPPALAQMKAGKLRLLAIGGPKRLAQAPDVPTLAEALGQSGYEANVWYGFVAPAGTPREAIAKLSEAIAQAMAHPPVRERVEKSGTEIDFGGAESFTALLRRENEKWAGLVKSLGLSAN